MITYTAQIDGSTAGTLQYFKDTSSTIHLVLLNNRTKEPVNITGETVTVELWSGSSRSSGTKVHDITPSVVDAVSGHMSMVLTDVTDFGTYTVFFKFTQATGVETYYTSNTVNLEVI